MVLVSLHNQLYLSKYFSLQPNYTNTDYTSNNIKNWDFKYGYNTTNYSVYPYRGQVSYNHIYILFHLSILIAMLVF